MENEIESMIIDARRILRSAFPEGTYVDHAESTGRSSLTREACLRLRTKLPYFYCHDLKLFLPAVLDELLDARDRREGGDMAIYFLNPEPYVAPTPHEVNHWLQSLKHHVNSDHVRRIHDALNLTLPRGPSLSTIAENGSLEERFCCFTAEQNAAVLTWLLIASSWDEFHFIRRDLQQAVVYWFRRVGFVPPVGHHGQG